MPDDARFTAERRALVETLVPPAESRLSADGTLFIDFGRAAFGTLVLPSDGVADGRHVVVHLGEKLGADGRIDREPPGTIRYRRIEQAVEPGGGRVRLVIPTDARNTGPGAVLMPERIGEVLPFRYAEIEQGGGIDPASVRQVFVHYPFDDEASAFKSSDAVLNAVWDMCKHTIKATTFCGVYVDGDRERIPYEADAYINQLGHYGVDAEYALARYTHEYLIQYPTWPTEWQLCSVLMAWADYVYTGDAASLGAFYDDLCVKALAELARADGLISTQSDLCTREFEERLHLYHPRYIFNRGLQDLVDWPPGSFTQGGQGERDGHEMMPVNTVVNAFHFRALTLMSRIAGVLGRGDDERRFAQRAQAVRASINRCLFDTARGVYIDGEGSDHASLHSNMFVLAFDVVPDQRRGSVVDFVLSRGMACSVYGAQFLLEALYKHGEDAAALGLMTARHDRGWWNMLEAGSTMTLEAWDWRYKNNLDWNHAWGTAPANVIPRYLMGVRPLEAGFRRALIQPRPGGLTWAEARVPTILGPVSVRFENPPDGPFVLDVEVPDGMDARVDMPGHTEVVSVGPGRHRL